MTFFDGDGGMGDDAMGGGHPEGCNCDACAAPAAPAEEAAPEAPAEEVAPAAPAEEAAPEAPAEEVAPAAPEAPVDPGM